MARHTDVAVLTEPLMGSTDYDKQREIEQESRQDGIARYRRLCASAVDRGQGAQLKAVERLRRHWIGPLAEEIRKEQRTAWRRGMGGFGKTAYAEPLNCTDPDTLACITIDTMVNELMREARVPSTRLAFLVGREIVAYLNHEAIRSGGHLEMRAFMKRFRFARAEHINWYARKELEQPLWSYKQCVYLGQRLIWFACLNCFASDYGVQPPVLAFKRDTIRQDGNQLSVVWLTDEAHTLIEEGHSRRQFIRPTYPFMLVPPFRTTKDEPSGYLTIHTPVIRKITKEQRERLDAADLSEVFDCQDAINQQAWQINPWVLQTMRREWESGGGTVGVPFLHDRPLPPAVRSGDKAAIAASRKRRREVHEENRDRGRQRTEFLSKLGEADKWEDAGRFYIPHYMDYRSRVYPFPAYLSHQGDDVCRGLLRFADSVPSDERWLKIHASNCWGFDKAPLSERAAWADEHAFEIERAVSDPHTDEWWRGADKPWQFLAACHALCDDGAGQRLPVQVDGTCNGLQHYAAMGRDEIGAREVNLLPSDTPQDVYRKVAGIVRRRCEALIEDDGGRVVRYTVRTGNVGQRRALNKGIRLGEIAKMALPHIGRPSSKRNVMTKVFNVTAIGATDQVREVLRDEAGLDGNELYRSAQLIANLNLEATAEVCRAAAAIMDWLEECGRIIAKSGRLIEWETELGWPVVQPYRRWDKVKLHTHLGSLTIVAEDHGLPPVSVRKQVNCLPPNFIHSIDATHLMRSARRARSEGLAFGSVHDCYWSHAGTMGQMGEMLREEFVRTHATPQHHRLHDQWKTRYYLDLNFPEPPETGDMDLSSVLASQYAFS